MAADLKPLGSLEPVAGIRLGTACAGIKKPGRRDLVVIECAPGTQAAGVFTQNAFCAAPVIVAREHLVSSSPRYLLVNTGNANAGTGARGVHDARACCAALAAQAGCRADEVLPFSTGVIGEPLPVERLVAGMSGALSALAADDWAAAAEGIMTTDTQPKGVSRVIGIGGRTVTITGIAKGAGMIRPDMATMLAFIATDAALPQALLQECLVRAVAQSFNRITVDGDTSTNDACLLLASGVSGVTLDEPATRALFQGALDAVCRDLAQAIVRDGEGATKFISIRVEGGRDEQECLAVAYTIAHSPLVKTAMFASDPNWGRLLACVGRAGLADLDLECVVMWLGDSCIVRDGGRAPDYTEAAGRAAMSGTDITVRVQLARGAAQTELWTCDFSCDYVRINAEYRT
jgi:glutamate N-acetyltransferase/amino-acid N-acetyltransferase